jgi:hypothetical protein
MFLGTRARPVTTLQPTVWTMWGPRQLTTLEASTACHFAFSVLLALGADQRSLSPPLLSVTLTAVFPVPDRHDEQP